MNAVEVERRIERADALIWMLAAAHESPHMMEADRVDLVLSVTLEQLKNARHAMREEETP